MNLRNRTRAELEACTPFVRDVGDTIVARALDSFDLFMLKNDVSLTPSISKHGYWEGWITSWFSNNLKQGSFVLDVGANCGYYTMLFERLVGPTGQVWAFEPSPVYVELLEKTKAHNDARFYIIEKALSDENGTVVLSYPGNYTGSATIVKEFDNHSKWGERHNQEVEAIRLDDFFEHAVPIDMIKIDAESAEEKILDGGEVIIGAYNPIIALEFSPTGAYSEGFIDRLFDMGFVTRIGYNGKEEAIDKNHLRKLTDWDMIVIRPRR